MRTAVCCLVYCLVSTFVFTINSQQLANETLIANRFRNIKFEREIASAVDDSTTNVRIEFPDFEEQSSQSARNVAYETLGREPSDEIPLSLIRQLNEASDIVEFMNFVDNATVIQLDGQDPIVIGDWDDVSERFAGAASEGNSGVPAKAAICLPENQTVSLITNDNPSVFYHPTCTRIERCGGCCTSPLLVCEPTKIETVYLQVIKTQYKGGARMIYAGKETVEVERHLACKCSCRVKPENCNKSQVYEEKACLCRCTNDDEKRKCDGEFRSRIWDHNSCTCRCRETKQCSTGYYYEDSRCRCEAIEARRVDVSLRAALGEGGRGAAAGKEGETPKIQKKKEEDFEADEKLNVPVQRVPLLPYWWTLNRNN